jgi:transposase
MISLGIKVFIARDRVRMSKSYDGLSLLVKDALKNDPLSGYMFVFFNKRSNYMKALYWDRKALMIFFVF